jgi:hypothetical protein
MFKNFFFENRAFYEIMWKNIVELGWPQMAIRRMRIACWIPKATNAPSVYVKRTSFSTATMVARTHLSVTLYVHSNAHKAIAGFFPKSRSGGDVQVQVPP